jgi:omega-amidase
MEDLRITLIQAALRWEDTEANRQLFGEKINSLQEPTDLILLPEMFSTGFSMQAAALAEEMNGPTVSWLKEMAAAKNCTLCGSLILKENGNYYNRLIWMNPDGTFLTYDKRHLFRLAEEQKTYTPGTKKIIPEIKGWKILPLVCYDLRFPVWSRRTQKEDYDLLVYVANWPDRRIRAWEALLPARAIENQSFVAGLNRMGDDGNGIPHSGRSAVYDCMGATLWQGPAGEEATKTVTLPVDELVKCRRAFPFDRDADQFNIQI